MFHGVCPPSRFYGDGTSPDLELPHERLELLTFSASFSFPLGPGFPCGSLSSVTLTVLLESPSPSADPFVVAPLGTLTDPRPDTFFPARKASLSEFDEAASRAYLA